MPAILPWVGKWKNGVIPYEPKANHPYWNLIVAAMEEFMAHTNIKFVPRTTEADYVVFVSEPQGGNSAPLGCIGGVHYVNIVSNVRQAHEFGHLVGLIHEHQRSDRDDYIDFDLDAVDPAKKDWMQSQVLDKQTESLNFGPLDPTSIMMYWTSAGGKDAETHTKILNLYNKTVHHEKVALFNGEHRTMYLKQDPNFIFDTPSKLSKLDCEGINRILYPPNEITLPFYQFKEVNDGSQVMLMHVSSKCTLHSHPINLSTGSKQQEVTCFWKQDDNDYWRIHRSTQTGQNIINYNEVIGLEHVVTGHWLHSHSGPELLSPVTNQQEVTCSINRDVNDWWRVNKVEGQFEKWLVGDVIKLTHVNTGMVLHSHGGENTGWRYTPVTGQQEVTAYNSNDANDYWMVVAII
jgi:hypothetical protein